MKNKFLIVILVIVSIFLGVAWRRSHSDLLDATAKANAFATVFEAQSKELVKLQKSCLAGSKK